MSVAYASTTIRTPTTMATVISHTQSKIVYVWAPYSVFLVVVFLILGASFFRRSRKVLKKRRITLEYMEAHLMCKRPRINRIFTSSMNIGVPYDRRDSTPRSSFRDRAAREFLNKFSRRGSINDYSPRSSLRNSAPRASVYDYEDHGEQYADDFREFPGEGFSGLVVHPELRTSQRYLQVPDIRVGKTAGLQDSDQTAWLQDAAVRSQHNVAFSFDEDLGRSHLRRVAGSDPQAGDQDNVQGGAFESVSARRGSMSHMDALGMESQNPLMNPCSVRNSPGRSREMIGESSADTNSRHPLLVSEVAMSSGASDQRRQYQKTFSAQIGSSCTQCAHDSYNTSQRDTSSQGCGSISKSVRKRGGRKNGGSKSKSRKEGANGGPISGSRTKSSKGGTKLGSSPETVDTDHDASSRSGFNPLVNVAAGTINSTGDCVYERVNGGNDHQSVRPRSAFMSDSLGSIPKSRRSPPSARSKSTDSETPLTTPRDRPEQRSLKSRTDRIFTFSKSKSDSQSTTTTVLTDSSQSTVHTSRSSGQRAAGRGQLTRPDMQQMFSALEVYTIPISSATDECGTPFQRATSASGRHRSAGALNSEFDQRETTAFKYDRTQSAFFALLPTTVSTPPCTSSTTTTTTAVTPVSGGGEKSIFWLGADETMQQTLV